MLKVLLADDEEPYLLAVGDFLTDEGYDVELVKDATGVREKGASVDVLVVDVRLPSWQLEGIEAVGELLSQNLLRPTVPVIFISVELERAQATVAALQRCHVPIDRFRWLTKPFELTRLVSAINSELARLKK